MCRDLDGIPLAIELAAARLRMLSTEQISSGLSDRFRLLTGGPRTALERHQTLRASVDWSHDLLSAEEQTLLRRLAVFTGGFTLEEVEQVCAGDGLGRDRLLDLLGSLLDQSLVIADERDRGVRYRLLETVRQYGLERLAEPGEEQAVRTRHRDHFLALAEEARPHLETGRQFEWLEVLDPESANLMAAIDYALWSEPPLALRFCVALRGWWRPRGRSSEAELVHSRSLDACGDREPALRARAIESRADPHPLGGRLRGGGGVRNRGAGARGGGRGQGNRRAGAPRSRQRDELHEPVRGEGRARACGRARPGGGRRPGARSL